jgi:hypothetical protein
MVEDASQPPRPATSTLISCYALVNHHSQVQIVLDLSGMPPLSGIPHNLAYLIAMRLISRGVEGCEGLMRRVSAGSRRWRCSSRALPRASRAPSAPRMWS